jgi:hypothetical protein
MNFDLKIKKDNKPADINIQNLLDNKQVLFCSITRLKDNSTYKYIEYLEALQHQCPDLIIYVICSCFGVFPLIQYDRHFPNLRVVCDTENKFVSCLADQIGKTEDIDFLAKHWDYQALFTDGKFDKFYEQPTSNRWQSLMKNKILTMDNLKRLKPYVNRKEQLIFDAPFLVPLTKLLGTDVPKKIFFYNLWPNVDLEQHLKIHDVHHM